eukprot:711578_1
MSVQKVCFADSCSDDIKEDDYTSMPSSADAHCIDLNAVHNILKHNHVHIDTSELSSSFGEYKHDKNTFIGDLIDALRVVSQSHPQSSYFNLQYDPNTIHTICETLLYQYVTKQDLNNANFIKLAQQMITESDYESNADHFQRLLTKTDPDDYTLVKGKYEFQMSAQFLQILSNIQFKMDALWHPTSQNTNIPNYCPSLSSGVYGSFLYYRRGQLIDHPSHLIDEFYAQSITKQLELSIPDDISVFHILHELSKDTTHDDPDVYRYPYMRNVIVSNSKEQFCVPIMADVISMFDEQDIDWKAILYDVGLYYYAECGIKHVPFTMDTFTDMPRNELNEKQSIEWKQYLRTKPLLSDAVVALEPTHKIMDNILAYHHYTIAVSHILKSYRVFKAFTLSLAFVINQRDSLDSQRITDIGSTLEGESIAYIRNELNPLDLNETIKIIFDGLFKYKDISDSNQMVLLFAMEPNNPSSACTMYIYDHQLVPNDTIIPHMEDNDSRLFVLQFQYLHTKHVKCYWKIDGKTLRFFPEHMETLWPKYFTISSDDINPLIYHHKYRHQFGVGLYDKAFCTLYYALTHRRFLSTHYYRKYQIASKLSLRRISVNVEDSAFDLFYDQVADLLNESFFKAKSNPCSPMSPLYDKTRTYPNTQYPVYTAEHSDGWLSPFNPPKYKTMKEELLNNSFSTMHESEYLDIAADCQILHKNKEENTQILSVLEIAALKVWTDYPQIQKAFSLAYYDSKVDDKEKRRAEFYRWNLVLKQAMHYASRDAKKTLWRGLSGLFHLRSMDINAFQPTTFAMDKASASGFTGKRGTVLEASDVIGIPLNWISSFSSDDDWLCLDQTFKVTQIHVKTRDAKERLDYLKYALQNAFHDRIEIFQFDDGDMRQNVLDMLEFKGSDDATLLQTLFFELKQNYILEAMWNSQVDDIERCSVFKRMYLLRHRISFTQDASDYKQYIIDIMKRDPLSGVDASLSGVFMEIMNECMSEYNADAKNRFKIDDTQRERVIEYFKSNKWDLNRFISTNSSASREIKSIFIRELKKRSPAMKLYKIVSDKICDISGTKCSVSFDAFYGEYVEYKQMDACNAAQLMYILEKKIYPKMKPQSAQKVKEYIEMHQLQVDGHSFLSHCVDHVELSDLYRVIKEWQADKDRGDRFTVLDYKVQNTKYNSFELLIGDFEMECSTNENEIVFQIKFSSKQQRLMKKQAPSLLVLCLDVNGSQIYVESSTPRFTVMDHELQHKSMDVEYTISFKFGEYELTSPTKHVSL